MFPNEGNTFVQKATKNGFACCYQPGPTFVDSRGTTRMKGGVVTMIKKIIPHKVDSGFFPKMCRGWFYGCPDHG